MKLKDFARLDDPDPTVKVEAVCIYDAPTKPLQAVDERYAQLYLHLREFVHEELAQSIVNLVRLEARP